MRPSYVTGLLCAAGCTAATPQAPGDASRVGSPPATNGSVVSFDAREATRLSFDITPNGMIVLDLFGQLWTMPLAGGTATAITDAVRDTSEDFDPVVSADGRRIVFQSDRPGGRALWLLSIDGGATKRLTTRPISYFAYASPSWSPDGGRLAYAVGDTLSLLDVDTGRETPLRIDSVPRTSQPPFTPQNGMPAWSPDGSQIAFVNTAPGGSRGEGRIWVVPSRGGVAAPYTSVRGVSPTWSRDGSRIAFFGRDSLLRWQLWVQERGGTPMRLTSDQEIAPFRVRWTPDGGSLVYLANGNLWRVPAAGGSPARIPFTARVSFHRNRATLPAVRFPEPGAVREARGFNSIALSPDGQRIAMIALDSVWIGDAGQAMRAIASASEAGDRDISWSPDGAELAFPRRTGPGRPFDIVAVHTGTGAQRTLAALGMDLFAPLWSPDGRMLSLYGGGRLRLVRADSGAITPAQASDLGPVGAAFGTMAWSPRSDGLVVSMFDFTSQRTSAQWIPVQGERRPVSRFPRAPLNLTLLADGNALWVEDNLLWRAPFEPSSGLQGERVRVTSEPAVEARYARDGSALYLSSTGLRLRRPDASTRTIGWPLRYRVSAAPAPILIRGVRVIDGTGTPASEPRDVMVSNGRIARIAAAGSMPPSGARIIEATGAFLVPGFIDLHAHIWDDLSLASWLHNGVTTIRDIASQKAKTPDTRNAIEAGIRQGPRIVYGGAMFHGLGNGLSSLSDQMPTDVASTARALDIFAGLGERFVKERSFAEWYRAVWLVTEAHKRGMAVSGHCEHILPLVAAGVDAVEHVLDCFRDRDPLRGDFAELARAAGLAIVPTAALRYTMLRGMDDSTLATGPDVAPFLPAMYKPLYGADSINRRNRTTYATSVERTRRSLQRYQAAGVPLATGTDSPFPLGVQEEMAILVEAGLTPLRAVAAATSVAARVLNTPEIGMIAEGQLADLLILDANPADDIRNTRRIREVIQGGRVVDRQRLKAMGLH